MLSLQYGHYTSGSLIWDSSMDFNALRFFELPVTDTVFGSTLRGIKFRHTISQRKCWELCISADELADSAKYDFIKEFCKADAGKFSTDSWTTETEVSTELSGSLPVEFVEGHKELPEITLLLIQKYPD